MSEIKEGYTRVSSVSGMFGGYHKIKKHTLEIAAERGKAVHKIIEDHMNDIPIEDERFIFSYPSEVGIVDQYPLDGYFKSWQEFYKPYEGAEVIMQELRLYDEERFLTGEPDLIVKHEGKIILFDWKCTYSISTSWRLQASGYHYLASKSGVNVDEMHFVQLSKRGEGANGWSLKPNHEEFFWAYHLYKTYAKNLKCHLDDE